MQGRLARLLSLLGFTIAVLLSSANFSNAQQVFGRIFGTVTDATGGAVANAKVTITDQNKGTTFDVTTNESGNYEKGQLIPGTYTVTVGAPGFNKSTSKDILVQVDNAARVDTTLQAGNVTETIEVTAAAPTLQADRADVQTTFSSKQLVDLPSLGRNAQAYELLTPGTSRVATFAHATSEDPQGSAQIIVNGQHFSSTGYQLDGTENQDPILGIVVINSNIDSLNEQKIASQDYDAEFGYAAAGILNASTKSGTNDFHGSAFDYFRNNSGGFTSFARNPFSEPNGALPFKYNQFGGSIGGKIIKDKLFFFGDAELIRQRVTGSASTNVPTQAARTGDFSQYPNLIYDPQTGNATTGAGRIAFANNRIPTARLSAQALAILQYFPLPNIVTSSPLANNYAASGATSFDANKWDTREDYFMNEKTTMFGRYSNHQFQKSAVGAFGDLAGGVNFSADRFAGTSFVRNQSIAFGTTHTFNPSLVNEFRFGYMKYHVQTTPNGVGTAPATQAGIPNLNTDAFYTSGMPYFNFVDPSNDQISALGYALGANGCNCPLTQSEGQYQFTDNISKTAGNHTFKFGADIRYAKNLRVPSDSHRAGELTFNTQRTGLVTGGNATGGLAYATFLLGDVTAFSRYVSSTTNAAEHQRRWFFYGQDSWRATPKLTINWGLRWELVFPEQVNGAGNGAQLDLRTGYINMFGIGDVSVHGVQNMNYLNLAPRLGIAYQMTPKTVIRAGYGWAYGLGTFGATFGHNVTQNPPVLFNQTPQSATGASFQQVFTLAQGPPPSNTVPIAQGQAAGTPFVTPASGQFILAPNVGAKARPEDVRLPRTMAYNITVEQQIASNTSLSVGYVGNVGRHVGGGSGDGYNFNVNQAAYIPAFANSQDLAKPYFSRLGANGQPLLWNQSIDLYCMCLTSSYNSLQVQLKRRFSGGLGLQISYTWQDAQSDNNDAYTILYNRPLGRGRQNSISDHALTGAVNYSIPFGRGRRFGQNMNRGIDAVLGGWDLSGITSFYSGLPFTPNFSVYPTTAVRPYTGPNNRADVGSGDPYAQNQSRDAWINPAAFAVPANGTFGNYPFNSLRGPIFINEDANVSKNFKVTEKVTWQIRAEAYNLFNHTNLGLFGNNGTDTTANINNGGTINQISLGSTMRRLQFAMRLDF